MTNSILPKRVLVGVSLSDDPFSEDLRIVQGDLALIAQAQWYAEKVGAEITFFHVIEAPNTLLPDEGKHLHELIHARIEPFLNNLIKESKSRGIQANYRIDAGTPTDRLIKAAEEDKHDLVMVCFHRDEAALERLFHGSTSKRLLRYCPAPVWVVSPQHQTPALQHILVAVDFSDASASCVAFAQALHDLAGTELYLIHALEYPAALALRRTANSDDVIDQYRKNIRKEAKAKVKELLGEKLDEWHVFLVDHPIARQMKDLCEQKSIELVIMGTVARTGVAGFFMGNTAERILTKLDTPVLALKPAHWKQA